jgi:protein phosphatase
LPPHSPPGGAGRPDACRLHLGVGNHEDPDVNAFFGFKDECLQRLGATNGQTIWQRANRVGAAPRLACCFLAFVRWSRLGGALRPALRGCGVCGQLFAWLPLAALVDQKILCLHGGIGQHFTSVDQLREVARPLPMPMTSEHAGLLRDVLWADPTDNDLALGRALLLSLPCLPPCAGVSFPRC